MESSLQSIIAYLNEIRRLKKKYPEATSFMKLSELYPTLSFEKDVILPFKKDSLGIKMHVFEEKDINGVLESDFLPIEYHSSYALGVAQNMIQYMQENEAFFREFLKGFDKIVVDTDAVRKSDSLVIRNYNSNVPISGYSRQNFVEAVLGRYGINSEKNSELIGRLSNTSKTVSVDSESAYAKPSYIDILTDGTIPFEMLANYYATNGRYADLRFLFDNRYNPRAVNKRIIYSEPFEFLNDVLDIMPEIVTDNADILKPAIDETVLTIKRAENFGSDVSSISCDKDSTINLVKDMLTELDPSGKFSNEFSNALKNGCLLSYEKVNDTEEDYVAYRENEDGKLEAVDMQSRFFSDYVNFTNTNSLMDVVDLMDGFIRYYMASNHTDTVRNYKYISEAIPAYYEYRTCSWLAENGFDANEVKRIFNIRRADCLGTSKIDGTPLLVDLISKKGNDDELTADNILTSGQLASHINFRKAKGLSTPNDDFIKTGYAINCAEMVRASRGVLNTDIIGYSLGYQLGKEFSLEEMDQRMTWVIDNCSNKEFEAADLVNVLRNGVSHVHTSDDELNDMFDNSSIKEVEISNDLGNNSGPTYK